MSEWNGSSPGEATTVPDLAVLVGYLRSAGWTLEDDDGRTTLWRPEPSDTEPSDTRIVLPVKREVRDYAERVNEALRTLAYVERRLPQEISADMSFGGADNVSVRLTPNAPAGEAPLFLAHSAISALRNYVVASATALDADSLVLPPRRPQRAEAYAAQARVSTQPGSFVLSLTLPLVDVYTEGPAASVVGQESLLEIPSRPFGRKVTSRMLAAAQRAQRLAAEVGEGDKPLSSFGQAGQASPNATELEALSLLGGPDHDVYQIRFSQSPLASGAHEPARLKITPGQQRILGEAANFLRTKQPRAGITVIGLVVRLFRAGKYGKGEAVIQGVDDDTGNARRFRVELDEHDYNLAVKAHATGLEVTATGDLDIRGTRRSLRRLTSFSLLPGIGDD